VKPGPGSGGRYDAIVLGGGPAGSTAAALLAGSGRSVLVLEKETFPRFHIGESLLPFNLPLFRRLGILDRLDGRFLEKRGARLLSGDGRVTRYICFEKGFVPGHPRAFQVLRSEFDDLLLRNAAARGAEVCQGFTVQEASTSLRDGCAVVARGSDGTQLRARGRFLLDATGREAFLASRRGLRRPLNDLRKAAFFAHYAGVPREEGHHPGDILLILLADGWFWMIPFADGNTSVGLVTDGGVVRRCGLAPADLLETALTRCPAARERMRSATRLTPVHAASDYSYECRAVAGEGYLLLGDAAAFIDPLFSTGVWLAMSSAELAADALHRALGSDGGADGLSPAAFAPYARRVRSHVRTYLRIVRRFYAPGFVDLFLQPTAGFRIRESVVSLLAGLAEPPLPVRIRLECFYALIRIHRWFGIVPRVPLLRVLEEPAA
jgi:FADH2-dependent halogenase